MAPNGRPQGKQGLACVCPPHTFCPSHPHPLSRTQRPGTSSSMEGRRVALRVAQGFDLSAGAWSLQGQLVGVR